MKTKNYNLLPVWNAILDVYQEIFKICERHHLRIFVAYGTCLGAVRHKGFIPWDDDFDVFMPRPDYNQFMKFAERELPSHLRWHSIENDSMHPLLYAKVKDERAELIEKVKGESNLELHQGIFVDVFPMDGLPSTKVGVFFWLLRRSIMRRYLHPSPQTLQRYISRLDYDRCKNVGWCLSDGKFPRFIFKKEWFGCVLMLPFDKTEVPIPVGYDDLLRQNYGDYMQLPPEVKRVPTHQVIGQ